MKKGYYIRTSTAEQHTARQHTSSNSNVYEDKVSGAIPFAERPQGKKLLNDILAGKITEVEVSSLSRLGRKMTDLLHLMDFFETNKVNLIIKDLGISSRPDGKPNKIYGIISLLMANMAEMQRQEMLESQAQAIKIKREDGLKYHNTARKTEKIEETLEKYKNVLKDINRGFKDVQILKTNYIICDKNYFNLTDQQKRKYKGRTVSRNTLKKIKSLRENF